MTDEEKIKELKVALVKAVIPLQVIRIAWLDIFSEDLQEEVLKAIETVNEALDL